MSSIQEPNRRLSLRNKLSIGQNFDRERSTDSISPPSLQRARGRTSSNTSSTSGSTYGEIPLTDISAGSSTSERVNSALSQTTFEANEEPRIRCTSLKGIASSFNEFSLEVKQDHEKLAALALSSTRITEYRVRHGKDLFAGLRSQAAPEPGAGSWRILSRVRLTLHACAYFKLILLELHHSKGRKEKRSLYYPVIKIETIKERVPPYRFHHVSVNRNILTPNTSLTFVPHVRDLKQNEEAKYKKWLNKLTDNERQSGVKSLNGAEKHALMKQLERAAAIQPYLPIWLERLAIPECTVESISRYLAMNSNFSPTATGKAAPLGSDDDHAELSHAERMIRRCVAAFQIVFHDCFPPFKRANIRHVLPLDSVRNIVVSEMKDMKAGQNILSPGSLNEVDKNISTFSCLGCLICFSHSCDHGEYDLENSKQNVSMVSCHESLSNFIRRRQLAGKVKEQKLASTPCGTDCYLSIHRPLSTHEYPPLTERERAMPQSLALAETGCNTSFDPVCLAAALLGRQCNDVYSSSQSTNLDFPRATARPTTKAVSWYNRWTKQLAPGWEDHTVVHAHDRRAVVEPCSHDGPCRPKICPCVDAELLCEKLCGCSAKVCARKFRGCDCEDSGKTCSEKEQDNACICRLLNRECDPDLCRSCGVQERAQPASAKNADLHSTGCQNCDIQRSNGKRLAVGQSFLPGVGYGLFTMEDVSQGEFVIEYLGELISQDEGVRREERRGDVFGEKTSTSFLFTLLDGEGLWLDAGSYGNLSRYINHAPAGGLRGCNITPTVLYVNGEWRIKFTALRDLKQGEELFFNYGQHFPNLTEQLVDQETEDGLQRSVLVPVAVSLSAKKSAAFASPGVSTAPSPSSTSRRRRLKRRRVDDSDDAIDNLYSGAPDSSPTVERQASLTNRLRHRHSMQLDNDENGGSPGAPRRRGGFRPGSGRPKKLPRTGSSVGLMSAQPRESYLNGSSTASRGSFSRRTATRQDRVVEDSEDEMELFDDSVPLAFEETRHEPARRQRPPLRPTRGGIQRW